MEGYYINPFILSPSYAGIYQNKTLFIDYRSDLSGFEGNPTTYEISYSDKFRERVGLGLRFIYDKTDIFKHTLILGTYTYKVKIAESHTLNFGLSVGFYKNSIDLEKYYNNPGYVQDLVLIQGLDKSKLLFATDISALYMHKQLETGILYSNVIFGTMRYRYTEMTYKPFKNYLIHASYLFNLESRLAVKPAFILRGGQYIPLQLELAANIKWNNKFWGTTLFRSAGILGIGCGGELFDGVMINYSYNVVTNVSLYTFGTHQLTLGISIPGLMKKETKQNR